MLVALAVSLWRTQSQHRCPDRIAELPAGPQHGTAQQRTCLIFFSPLEVSLLLRKKADASQAVTVLERPTRHVDNQGSVIVGK